MSDFLFKCYLSIICSIETGKEKIKSLYEDERGISPIIATVLILLFVVLLAVVFWENISEWFEALWDRILGEGDPDNFNL